MEAMCLYRKEPWEVVVRINRAGNLTIETYLNGALVTELIQQDNEDLTVDLGTASRPWPLGPQGWDMPGSNTPGIRKYRFSKEPVLV